jgi:hypothetical protein
MAGLDRVPHCSMCAAFGVALQLALSHVDPRGHNLQRSARAYGTIWLAVMTAPVLAQGLVVATALGASIRVPGLALAASGGLLVVVGNVLGKLRWNYSVGIRTPWTIADERVWDQTHRFGGKLFVACGALLLAAFTPVAQAVPGPLISAAALAATVGSTLKSWLAWRARRLVASRRAAGKKKGLGRFAGTKFGGSRPHVSAVQALEGSSLPVAPSPPTRPKKSRRAASTTASPRSEDEKRPRVARP